MVHDLDEANSRSRLVNGILTILKHPWFIRLFFYAYLLATRLDHRREERPRRGARVRSNDLRKERKERNRTEEYAN